MSCAIEGCSSHTGRKENLQDPVTFHRFPKDEDIKKKWLLHVKKRNWTWTIRSVVCSRHFTPDSFIPSERIKWRRLRADAFPTLYLSNTDSLVMDVDHCDAEHAEVSSRILEESHINNDVPKKLEPAQDAETKPDVVDSHYELPDVFLDSSMKENCQLQANAPNFRPVTPDLSEIPVDKIFSPTIQKEFRSTILALFPNGPPPPPSVRPMRRPKKGDKPYIVGCNKRARVPSPKSLTVFQGDDYGITDNTNCQEDEEQCPPAKRCRRGPKGSKNISKSRFNPQSNEIAERLKLYEKIDRLVGRTPKEEPVSYMSKQRPFSPLPSTSTDNQTIMKNDKHFNECFNSDSFDIHDDEDLPEVLWPSNCKKEIDRKDSPSLPDKDEEHEDKKSNTDNVLIEINEDINTNNYDITNNNDDFCEIQFDKYMPKEILLYYSDEEDVESKRQPEKDNAIDFKDGFPSPTTSTDVICVEDVFTPDTNGNVSVSTANTVTSVLRASNTNAPSTATTLSDLVIEVPDVSEPINTTREASTSRLPDWNEDVQFVSEVRTNETLPRNVSDVEISQVGTSASGTSENNDGFNTMSMQFLFELTRSFERENWRRLLAPPRRKYKRKPKQNPVIPVVNNENTAPSVSQALANNDTTQPALPTSPSAKNLGECPICFENLSTGSIASTNCGHVFCLVCIKQSLKASGKKCPTCRKQLRGVGYHQVFL